MRVTVVGRGRVGRGLHRRMRGIPGLSPRLEAGRGVRKTAVTRADVVVLAVPDEALAPVAARIAPWLTRGTVVLHCAGARGLDVLEACAEAGAHVGAMHPLVSFPELRHSPSLDGTSFLIAGDRRAIGAARRLARAVGARPVVAPVHGPAYHAAAALAANGAAAVATISVRVLSRLGLDQRDAERAVGALLRSVADNVERIGVPAALTGPVRRGDAATVVAHRRALAELDRDAMRAYDAVAPAIVSCAAAAGLSGVGVRAMRRALARRV